MRRSDLGEFEELVLLSVAVHSPEAYSVVIADELECQTGNLSQPERFMLRYNDLKSKAWYHRKWEKRPRREVAEENASSK
jgi:hypothetical protein